ncbi:MAG: TerD family protein [Flammeovirgaceae bacterium]
MQNPQNHKQPIYELQSGESLRLEKNNKPIEKLFLGLNWGAIQKKTRNFEEITFEVDLDSCLTTFDKNGEVIETVFFNNLRSSDKAIEHYGDDVTGDIDGDDGLDNEIIKIELEKIDDKVYSIFVYLVSANSQDLGELPYVSIRLFEGQKNKIESVFAACKLAPNEDFNGNIAIIIGKFTKNKGFWEFEVIGEPMFATETGEAVEYIKENFL